MSISSEELKDKGNQLYVQKQYKEAIVAYTEAINQSPEIATYYTNRAAAYLMVLEYNNALNDCNKAISIDKNNAKAYFRSATALKGLGKLDAAINILNEGLNYDNSDNAKNERDILVKAKNSIPILQQTVVNNNQHQLFSALSEIDNIIRSIGSNFRDFNILKADILLKLKKTEEAYNLTNNMMRNSNGSNDFDLLSLRSNILYAMGDMENTLKHLQQAVRLDPDNTTIRSFYRKIKEFEEKREAGNTSFKENKYEEAIAFWTVCIDMDPKNKAIAKLYCNRATANSKIKKNELAVDDATKAIEIDPFYIKAYSRRADSNYTLGGENRIKASIDDYKKILELQSETEDNNEIKKKLKQAEVALKRAGRKDLYSILGVSQGADDDELRKAYKKMALKHHPDRQSGKSEEEKTEAENKFKEINEAYEVLSDKEKRERYDSGIDVQDLENPHAGGGGMHGGIDPAMFFNMFMHQHGGMGGMGGMDDFGGFPGQGHGHSGRSGRRRREG